MDILFRASTRKELPGEGGSGDIVSVAIRQRFIGQSLAIDEFDSARSNFLIWQPETLRLWGLLGLLLLLTQPNYAEESPGFEKIRDVSPDGKFGVRISCVGEPEDPSNIDSSLITAVELVSLPPKKVVMNVGQPYVGALI